jgi:hypothetical protein
MSVGRGSRGTGAFILRMGCGGRQGVLLSEFLVVMECYLGEIFEVNQIVYVFLYVATSFSI